MKKTFVLSLICLLVFVGFVWGGSWHITTVDDSGNVENSTSIKLDSSDNPHIAYWDYVNDYLKYAEWNGSTWEFQTIDSSGDVGSEMSLIIDSSDNSHIAYYDATNDDLKYAYWNGSSWDIQSVDTGGDVGQYNSIYIDSSDNPHIAYYDATNDDLKYAYWNVSSWDISSLDTDGDVGMDCSIGIDNLDYVNISYYDATNSDLKFALELEGSWMIEPLDTFGEVGKFTSIAMDFQGSPHISYFDVTWDYLKYAYRTTGPWYIDSIVQAGDPDCQNSIVIKPGHRYPMISYFDNGTFTMMYAGWNGSSWDIMVVEQGDPGNITGLGNSIDTDSTGRPHISYIHSSDNYLRYAWYDPEDPIYLTTFTAKAKDDRAMVLNWSVETTEGEVITGFNLYRREYSPITEITNPLLNEESIWEKINMVLITGKNPYEYIDMDVETGVAYEYRLEAIVEEVAEDIGTTKGYCGIPTSFEITSVYPNPAKDSVEMVISSCGDATVKIAIYDILGRFVMGKDVQVVMGEQSVAFDTSSLASGVYGIEAVSGINTSYGRVVIVK